MQIIFAEYVCECGVSVDRMLPIGFDIKYKMDFNCPECGKDLCLLQATRMVSEDEVNENEL